MKEEKKYTGSKMNRIKAMLAMGIMTSALLFSAGMEKEAYAADAMKNAGVTSQHVHKFTPEQTAKINATIEKFEQERKNMLIEDGNTNSFRNNLRVDNPNWEYFSPNYEESVRSTIKKNGSTRITGNVNIGKITNDGERYWNEVFEDINKLTSMKIVQSLLLIDNSSNY